MTKNFIRLFVMVGLLAGMLGLTAPQTVSAQTTEVELSYLDGVFGETGYLCYPDDAGNHVKILRWPRNTPVTPPMLRVEQPFKSFEVGTQPQVGVEADLWLDSPLSAEALTNCPSMPSDGAGDKRNLKLTLDEVQSGIGEGEFLCFMDRRDGVRIVALPEGETLLPPFTHMDTVQGLFTRGSAATEDLEGSGWLQGKLSYAEWQNCPKWGLEEPENRILESPRGSAAVLQALLKALGIDVTSITAETAAPAATPIAAALPAPAPAATATVAQQLDALLGTGSWTCFGDRLNAVAVVWPNGVAVASPIGMTNTPSGDVRPGGTPTAGDTVTAWLESGLEVDRAECP